MFADPAFAYEVIQDVLYALAVVMSKADIKHDVKQWYGAYPRLLVGAEQHPNPFFHDVVGVDRPLLSLQFAEDTPRAFVAILPQQTVLQLSARLLAKGAGAGPGTRVRGVLSDTDAPEKFAAAERQARAPALIVT